MQIDCELQMGNHRELRAVDTINIAAIEKIKPGDKVLVKIGTTDTGKWGMARLFRVWCGLVGGFMEAQGITQPLMQVNGKPWGVRPFNEADAYELFTVKAMGLAPNGKRYSWSKKGKDGRIPADKGQRFFAIQQLEEWATNKGINLPKPADSEYCKLEHEQNR